MLIMYESINEREHYQTLQQEVKQYRLARQALKGRQKNQQIFCRVMNWLGSHLYIWGNHLLEHYGTTPKTTVLVRKHSG